MNNELNKCHDMVNSLFEKYKSNEYMLNRLFNNLLNHLPNTLEYEQKNYEKRMDRNNFLTNEQQTFVQVFLQKNPYYYLPNINLHYEYTDGMYKIIREDDIIHKLLSSISKDRVLLDWKQKTKINILKQIKERTLFQSIPETETIQNILNILNPTVFESRKYAKYFLTVIGDNILKKNPSLIFLVSSKMKKILTELDNTSSKTIGYNNISNNFMTKYHENHSYENCRLIKMIDSVSTSLWRDILKKIGLDLLCVAVHYSNRYGSSDHFIDGLDDDDDIKKYVLYLKHKTPTQVVSDFCDKYIQHNSDNENVTLVEWKNLHFVWKQFLTNYKYTNMIYSQNLKGILKSKYKFDEEKDTFCGIISKFIPVHKDFILFWEKTINVLHTDNTDCFNNEYEIDEITLLFKYWIKQNSDVKCSNGSITDDSLLQILKHYFNNIEIVEDKYFLNIECILWNKIGDINDSFKYIKERLTDYDLDLITLEEIYNIYHEKCLSESKKMIVSKRYFEKYLYFKLSDYIVYDKFIEIKSLYNL